MPGIGPLGYLAFGGVKLAGYTGAGAALNHYLPQAEGPSSLKVGATRTGIGIVAGFSYGLIMAAILGVKHDNLFPALFFGFLIPLRFLEWLVLLRIFFWDALGGKIPWKWMALGSGWSFVLDGVALACAFVVPGGPWIC